MTYWHGITFNGPLLFIFHRWEGNQNSKKIAERLSFFKNMLFFLFFASSTSQYVCANPHFVTKREGWSQFYNHLSLDVLPVEGYGFYFRR